MTPPSTRRTVLAQGPLFRTSRMAEDISHEILIALTGVIGLGIGAQWLAWRLRLPSILLLLVCGFVAGPITGFLDPESLLGPAILPVASPAVVVILFEGGLSLKISGLPAIGKDVRNLILLGGLITWGLVTAAAYWLLEFDLRLATLFGAILVVTGPTVVLPLLRHVQPSGRVRSLLKWEGILNDPVGAVLAVLVFEALFLGFHGNVTTHAATGMFLAVIVGVGFGAAGAAILLLLLKKYWIPDSERWRESSAARHLRGRRLFGDEVEFSSLADRFLGGAVVKAAVAPDPVA